MVVYLLLTMCATYIYIYNLGPSHYNLLIGYLEFVNLSMFFMKVLIMIFYPLAMWRRLLAKSSLIKRSTVAGHSQANTL